MFLIAVTNWKRKFIFILIALVILTMILTLLPLVLSESIVDTDTQSEDEDILNQPIKVQTEPVPETVDPVENINQ